MLMLQKPYPDRNVSDGVANPVQQKITNVFHSNEYNEFKKNTQRI
jgi:hypothetical protein